MSALVLPVGLIPPTGLIPPPGFIPPTSRLLTGAPLSWAVPADQLPPLCLFAGAKVGSLANVGEDGSFLSAKGYPTRTYPVAQWAAGFSTHHSDDAHTCCYAIKHLPTGQFIPDSVVRMSKPGLALAHALRDGSPRKLSLPEAARELLTSIEPMGTMLLVDLDNENHQPWSPLLRERALNVLADAAQKDPIFAAPTLFHTTRGGMRLVWVLSEPVPVEGARGLEDLLCGVIMRARQVGLEADASCGDWTRLFRLPLVTRPSKQDERICEQTWLASSLAMSWGCVNFDVRHEAPPEGTVLVHSPERFRALSEISRLEVESGPMIVTSLGKLWDRRLEREPQRSVTTLLDIETGACPDAAQVADFVQNMASDESLDYKSVKTWVKARAYPGGKTSVPEPTAKYVWEQLYGDGCLIDDPKASGQLHANLLVLTNRLAWVLRQRLTDADVSPQMLYLLCIQSARKANDKRKAAGGDARSDSDLEREVWSAVESAYRMRASEQRSFEQQRVEDDACAQEKALLAGRLRTTMEGAFKQFLMEHVVRGTGGPGGAGVEDGVKEPIKSDAEWVEQNYLHLLLIDTPDGISVAKRDKYGVFGYSDPAEDHGGVLAAVRDSGHNLIEIRKQAAKPGDPAVLKTLTELQMEYSSAVKHITLDREIPINRLRLVAHGEQLEPTLDLSAYGMRSDIEPMRDRRVEQWLIHLGGKHHEKLLDWLACYTRLEQPMTGLYIQGSPSIGKGMLGQALTKMTQTRTHGKLEHVLQQFQDSMFRTPFVWGDEEASPNTRITKSMMNVYKKLVTGEFDSLNPKGKTERTMKGYWRVYLTANGDKYLKLNDDVNDSDMEAIVVRTLHILSDSDACAQYLRDIGGRAATSGWPEHNIPCHVAWLRETRQVVPGSRLLVEGVRTDFHEQLAINTNSADLTLRTLVAVLGSQNKPRYDHVFEVKARKSTQAAPGGGPGAPDWRLCIRADELHQVMLKTMADDRSVSIPNPRAVEQALRQLSGEPKSEVMSFSSTVVVGKKRAWPLPLANVLKSIEQIGADLDCRAAIGEAAWQACATRLMRESQLDVPPPKVAPKAIQFPVPAHAMIMPRADTSNVKHTSPAVFPTVSTLKQE